MMSVAPYMGLNKRLGHSVYDLVEFSRTIRRS